MTLVSTRGRAATATVARASTSARVVLRCPGVSLGAGEKAVLRGRVIPVGAATTVTYQMRWDGGAWKAGATARLSAKGHYNFAIRVPRAAPAGRTYEWRVLAMSGRKVIATSQTRTAVVR